MLLRKRDAVLALAISMRQLDTYIKSGEIAVHRLGPRCVRIEQAELDRWVAERRPHPIDAQEPAHV